MKRADLSDRSKTPGTSGAGHLAQARMGRQPDSSMTAGEVVDACIADLRQRLRDPGGYKIERMLTTPGILSLAKSAGAELKTLLKDAPPLSPPLATALRTLLDTIAKDEGGALALVDGSYRPGPSQLGAIYAFVTMVHQLQAARSEY